MILGGKTTILGSTSHISHGFGQVLYVGHEIEAVGLGGLIDLVGKKHWWVILGQRFGGSFCKVYKGKPLKWMVYKEKPY